MNFRSAAGNWSFIVAAVIGGCVIVAGNAMAALGGTTELLLWGLGIRQFGLMICVITSIVFLLVRNASKIKQLLMLLQRTEKDARLSAVGPSTILVILIRLYCMLLILAGIYYAGFFGWQFFAQLFSPYRRMPQATWYLLYTMITVFLTLAPGFLIWGLTNVILRMSGQLEVLSRRTTQLEFGFTEHATNPPGPGELQPEKGRDS